MTNNKNKIENFYDLEVWQKAHNIAVDIYDITKKFPDEERFGLTAQMRRSAASITANIAEGFGRYHYKEKIKFYQNSRGSAMELQDQIFLAQDLGYIKKDKARKLFGEIQEVIKGLNGLISSINNQIDNS